LNNNLTKIIENTVFDVYQTVEKKGAAKFGRYDEKFLWYELISCILGSRVQFEHAQSYARYIKLCELHDVKKYVNDFEKYEIKVNNALSTPIVVYDVKKIIPKYRYPKLRANHIRRSAESITSNFSSLNSILKGSNNSIEARYNLVQATVGIGPKQASLFLRNIGFADDIAILDTHVLHYMYLQGIINSKIPGVATLKKYQEIEEKLGNYTKKNGLVLGYLDTAIWVTMRVYNREYVK
jgi:N-glycosylase/DNA lyase